MVALKSKSAKEELDEAKRAIKELDLSLTSVNEYSIKMDDQELKHTIITLSKLKETKDKYPRQFAKIKKSPL